MIGLGLFVVAAVCTVMVWYVVQQPPWAEAEPSTQSAESG